MVYGAGSRLAEIVRSHAVMDGLTLKMTPTRHAGVLNPIVADRTTDRCRGSSPQTAERLGQRSASDLPTHTVPTSADSSTRLRSSVAYACTWPLSYHPTLKAYTPGAT